jgi:xylulokinase
MYLGLDLGTSSVKALLVDEQETVVGEASSPLTISRRGDWSEQDPADWWDATLQAIDRLRDRHPAALGATRGIGLSGQMHGAVLLGDADEVLRPCILWNDGRSVAECARLEDSFPRLLEITGNRAMPGFTAPKLLWVAAHEPEVFRRTKRVLLPKAYLRLKLAGEFAEDMSDASGTLWLDVARRGWSDEALAATGLTRANMPPLVEGNAPTGRLRAELARRWSMATAPVVAGGAGDNAASAIGLGAIKPGDAFVSLGTSGVLWATTDRFRPNPARGVHAFCHALPDTWHQMGVILSAASSLEWWAGVSGQPVAALLGEVESRFGEPSGILFAPYLSGERTPHNDSRVRGAFVGLGHETDRARLTQAVLEGVAFAFRDCLDALAEAGTAVERARATGGGSQSSAWLTILADVLGIPLSCPVAGGHGAALGAARLGRLAATGEAPASVCRPPPDAETILPDAARVGRYAEEHARYRRVYRALKDIA